MLRCFDASLLTMKWMSRDVQDRPWARYRNAHHYGLLKCDFGKASELARMQAFGFLVLEPFERLQADLEMLTDASPVKFAGHACELYFAVQRLVGDA